MWTYLLEIQTCVVFPLQLSCTTLGRLLSFSFVFVLFDVHVLFLYFSSCQTGAVVWNRCMILYYRQQNIHTLCSMSYAYISGMNKCRQYEVSKSNQILIIRHLITVWSLRRGCRFGNNFLFFCGTFCHCQVLHTQTHARTDTHTHATHTHTHARWVIWSQKHRLFPCVSPLFI